MRNENIRAKKIARRSFEGMFMSLRTEDHHPSGPRAQSERNEELRREAKFFPWGEKYACYNLGKYRLKALKAFR